MHQPGQRGAGEQHAQAADAHGQARDGGEAVRRKTARDEDRADQESRRAADADQHLAQHQQAEVGGEGRQQGAGDGERKGGEHGAADAVQVDADAHEELHGTEGEVEGGREHAQLLRREAQPCLQFGRQDGGGGAVGLAEHEGRAQGQQHEPDGAAVVGRRRSVGRVGHRRGVQDEGPV